MVVHQHDFQPKEAIDVIGGKYKGRIGFFLEFKGRESVKVFLEEDGLLHPKKVTTIRSRNIQPRVLKDRPTKSNFDRRRTKSEALATLIDEIEKIEMQLSEATTKLKLLLIVNEDE